MCRVGTKASQIADVGYCNVTGEKVVMARKGMNLLPKPAVS